MIILATALPIRPNPLIATFVAICKSPFFQYYKCGFLIRFKTNKVATLLISGPAVKKLFQISYFTAGHPDAKTHFA